MPLPGPNAAISLNQVNVELGNPGTTQISMNDAAVRTLFAKPSGAISMSDGWGKSSVPPISGITVTMPHPQPMPKWPSVGNSALYRAGPRPGFPGPARPPSPSPANPLTSPVDLFAWGSTCSPNPAAREIVLSLFPANPTGGDGAPAPSVWAGQTQKNVTVSYTGGPTGPGPGQTAVSNFTWSISTDCPDYSPTSEPWPTSAYPLTGGPFTAPVAVLGYPSPTLVRVGTGLNRGTRGGQGPTQQATSPTFPAGIYDTPYPASPLPSWANNIGTRYVITGTAPAPLGGASGSTSWSVVCLPLDTEITMEDGSVRPMKDVKVGDRVKTYDPDTDEISSNEVTHLLKRHVASELIHVHLENDIVFRATPEHECWIRRDDEGMWIMAELIEEGDFMLTEGIEYKKVTKVERVEYEEGIEVGNFSVADAHVYFANKVLLHNFTGL